MVSPSIVHSKVTPDSAELKEKDALLVVETAAGADVIDGAGGGVVSMTKEREDEAIPSSP
jgi:hypothetical protein